jgi:GNAT superfamily N-acetyltransferase
MIEFAPIRYEPAVTARYTRLFNECFPVAGRFNLSYLDWLYAQNPYGRAVGFDAWDGDKLAAHYVGIPMDTIVDGQSVRALLSLNTATHPRYQGRGLFTKLAEHTYEAAAAQNIQVVFGVANANSTPGFVRKLGFQLVESLAAKVGLGPLSIDLAAARRQAQFRTVWTTAGLAWRCANPNNPVAQRARGDHFQLYTAAMGSMLPAYAELPADGLPPPPPHAGRTALWPLRLYLGLEPTGCGPGCNYVNIPNRLRPSPLNFIYKSLVKTAQQLERGRVSFSFLDFDAY